MFSARLIYSLGIFVSVVNIALWSRIVMAQVNQYKTIKMDKSLKILLLIFGAVSLSANFIPIWFDAYRLINAANPTNIFYAYVMNSYLYRTITTVMFFIIYRY